MRQSGKPGMKRRAARMRKRLSSEHFCAMVSVVMFGDS